MKGLIAWLNCKKTIDSLQHYKRKRIHTHINTNSVKGFDWEYELIAYYRDLYLYESMGNNKQQRSNTMKEIKIDELSIGDRILWCGVKMIITQTMYDILKASPILMQYVSRVPCTAENTKVEDWVLRHDQFEQVVNPNGYDVTDCFHPLQKELAEYLAKHKPLLADAEVGDLVRFNTGQVCEIGIVTENETHLAQKEINNLPDDMWCYLKSNGKYWADQSRPIYITELIKKGSLKWAVEMLKMGKMVTNEFGGYFQSGGFDITAYNSRINNKHGIEPLQFFTYEYFLLHGIKSGWTLYEKKASAIIDDPIPYSQFNPDLHVVNCSDCQHSNRQKRYELGYKKGYEAGMLQRDFDSKAEYQRGYEDCRQDMINKIKGE